MVTWIKRNLVTNKKQIINIQLMRKEIISTTWERIKTQRERIGLAENLFRIVWITQIVTTNNMSLLNTVSIMVPKQMMSLLFFASSFPKAKLMNLKRSHDQTKLVECFACDYMWFMGLLVTRTPAPAGAKVKMKMSIINDHDDDDEWQAISNGLNSKWI